MTPIALSNLSKHFGATVAVDDVTLDIAAGSLFFLLGPSGCGKTTLLRMIAGFAEPTAGAIRFGERDVTHTPPNKRNCGMVFQGYALWPHMTVRQNVGFGLSVRKTPKAEANQRIDEALALVQMADLGDRKPNQLSGGQQQRVALARALVINPTVLLLDEPLSNLDAKLRLEMRSQIRDIAKRAGTTAVYVTHDQKEALSMADAIAVLHRGRVAQVGSPRELYDRPSNRFVADFLGETNFIPAHIVSRDGDDLLLDSAAGRLRSSVFPSDLPKAGDVTCSVRPEAIRVTAANDGDASTSTNDANRLRARRLDLIYLGEVAQHLLTLGDGMTIRAFELNPQFGPNADTHVELRFDRGDVVVLKD